MSRFKDDKWKDELRKENIPHIFTEVIIDIKETQDNQVKMMQEEINLIKTSAFPNGDMAGHSLYHKIMIERNREIKALRNVILEKTLAGLVWAIMLFVGLAILNYVRMKLGYPPVTPNSPTG